MKTYVAQLLVVLAVVVAGAQARAEEMTAQVRTWTGADLSLSGASIEAAYTIPAPAKESKPAAGPGGAILAVIPSMISAGSAGGGGGSAAGASAGYGGSADQAPGSIQGVRTVHAVTLHRGGVEYSVPVSKLSSLTFRRQPVPGSTLPPYFVPDHYRHAATAMLSDGSQLEADYVNLGTTMVRGTGPQGMIEVPWQDIEVIRFGR